jgi:uncharacterized protein YgiM (DUF1202 family)
MRLAIASIALILVVPSYTSADEEFPHTAVIAQDRTPVRSGPGDDHYRTDELKRGTEIEVHQHTTSGWLAIRPLESSFSWVAQRDVEVGDDRTTALVIGSSAVSWIGSNSDDVVDHRWLVKLKTGEELAVLGKERRKIVADGKSDLYYKIAPPSGEFRWVHKDDVVASTEELEAPKKDPEVKLADFRVSLRERAKTKAVPPEAPLPTAVKETTTGEIAEAKEEAKKDDFSSRGSSATLSGNKPLAKSERIPKRELKSEPSVLEGGNTESRIRELDGRLSLLVAQPVEKWNFVRLRKDAEEIAAESSSTLERARVQVFLDKVSDFEGLRTRHATFAPPDTTTKKDADSKKSKQAAAKDKSLDPRFDGTGWLLPVHSTKRNAPPYALLDDDGNILQFVSPAPGLNLNRYLKKEVGIIGQKQPTDALDKPHLTAHRIVERDRHRR